jgi:glycine cleavage system H protein
MYPETLKYTKDHEWVRLDGDEAVVGITDFAQSQLGAVVFVELPDVGRTVGQGEVFGTIESVKAVSELFSPISGQVLAVNAELGVHPERVNEAPHDTWMIRLRPSKAAEFSSLLDAEGYAALTRGERRES